MPYRTLTNQEVIDDFNQHVRPMIESCIEAVGRDDRRSLRGAWENHVHGLFMGHRITDEQREELWPMDVHEV